MQTSTTIRKTNWASLSIAQVRALFRRMGVEAADAGLTLRLLDTGPHMSTNTIRPDDGSRAFYLRVTDQGCEEYDVELVWSAERDCGREGCAVGCQHDPGEGHSAAGYAANH